MGFFDDILDDTVDENSFGTLVAENAQWRLWTNGMTQFYERELGKYNDEGFTLQGKYMVVLAEDKISTIRTYLMLDKVTQTPVADWSTSEEFDLKKMLILDDLKQDCSIINMAKANKKKKRKAKR